MKSVLISTDGTEANYRWQLALSANDLVVASRSTGTNVIAVNYSTGAVTFLHGAASGSPVTIQSTHGGFGGNVVSLVSARSASTGFTMLAAQANGTDVMYILGNGNVQNTNNSYGAISDRKLKRDEVLAGSQWDDVKALAAVIKKFRLRSDPKGPMMIGWVAQDVEPISPALVDERQDVEVVKAKDGSIMKAKDGSDLVRPLGTSTKSVKYSIAHMKAFKALGEAMERIERIERHVGIAA